MKTTPQTRTLTPDEIETLFVELCKNKRGINEQRKCYRDRLLVLLMLDAGLRIQEALSIKIWQLTRDNVPCAILELLPEQCKGGAPRSVPITSRLAASIAVCNQKIWTVLKIPSTSHALGYRLRWEAPCPRAIQIKLANIGQSVLGFRLHPHMLRHTYATRLMKVANIRTVQVLLGHRSITSTERYTHPSTSDCQQAVKDMEVMP